MLLLLLIPLALNGELEPGATEGDVTFKLDNPTVYGILNAIRWACMLSMYGGFSAVIYSVCVIKNPNGPTPPVSPTMQCVMNLTIQFFFVYLMLWVLVTVRRGLGRLQAQPRPAALGLTEYASDAAGMSGAVQKHQRDYAADPSLPLPRSEAIRRSID